MVIEYQDAFSLVEEGQYDIIYDKGTFDVVYLNRDLNNEDYVRAVHFRLSSTNLNAIFIITSGNCTSAELDQIFCSQGLFEKKEEIKGYRQFMYGGVTGQNVSTNVYKRSLVSFI